MVLKIVRTIDLLLRRPLPYRAPIFASSIRVVRVIQPIRREKGTLSQDLRRKCLDAGSNSRLVVCITKCLNNVVKKIVLTARVLITDVLVINQFLDWRFGEDSSMNLMCYF